MAVDVSLSAPAKPTAPAEEKGKWRLVQGLLVAVVVGMALYYNTLGWRSPRVQGVITAETPPYTSPLTFLSDNAGFAILIGFILVLTPTALTVARATFQETLRRRVLNIILIVALVLIAASTWFSWMSRGEEEKFIRDFGLLSILLCGLAISIVLGGWLIPLEVERRTIFTLLAKPVPRGQLILGKFLGVALTLLVNFVIMAIMFAMTYYFKMAGTEGSAVWGSIWNNTKAVFLMYVEFVLLAAAAITISIMATSIITTVVFTFFLFFAGQLGGSLQSIGEHVESGSVQNLLKLVYIVLPNLGAFDVREKLILDDPVAFNYIWKTTSQGMIYMAIVLVIAWAFFHDKDF